MDLNKPIPDTNLTPDTVTITGMFRFERKQGFRIKGNIYRYYVIKWEVGQIRVRKKQKNQTRSTFTKI